jgi:uncharacterized protein (DUF2249 family)
MEDAWLLIPTGKRRITPPKSMEATAFSHSYTMVIRDTSQLKSGLEVRLNTHHHPVYQITQFHVVYRQDYQFSWFDNVSGPWPTPCGD